MKYEEVMKAKKEYLGDDNWDIFFNLYISPFPKFLFLSGVIILAIVLITSFFLKGNKKENLLTKYPNLQGFLSLYIAFAIGVSFLMSNPLMYKEPIERHKNYPKFESEVIEPYLLSRQPNIYYKVELVKNPRVIGFSFILKEKSDNGLMIENKIPLEDVEFRQLPKGESKSYIAQFRLDENILGKYKKGYVKSIGYFTEEELQSIQDYTNEFY